MTKHFGTLVIRLVFGPGACHQLSVLLGTRVSLALNWCERRLNMVVFFGGPGKQARRFAFFRRSSQTIHDSIVRLVETYRTAPPNKCMFARDDPPRE